MESLMILMLNSSDGDCQRHCALALTNLASAPFNRATMARDDFIATIIPLIADDAADLITRQYCALCLGNLAGEPENQAKLMRKVDSTVGALMCLFRTEDTESGRCASFALGNFAANTLYRKAIVDAGAPSAGIAVRARLC